MNPIHRERRKLINAVIAQHLIHTQMKVVR